MSLNDPTNPFVIKFSLSYDAAPKMASVSFINCIMIRRFVYLLGLLASVAHSQTVSTSTPVQTKVKEIKDCGEWGCFLIILISCYLGTSSAITFQDATGDNIQNITMNVSEQVDSATLTYAIVEQGFKLLSFDGDFCTYLLVYSATILPPSSYRLILDQKAALVVLSAKAATS